MIHGRANAHRNDGCRHGGAAVRLDSQFDGSRAVEDIDAMTHNAANARPIIPKVNTLFSSPHAADLSAHIQVRAKPLRKT